MPEERKQITMNIEPLSSGIFSDKKDVEKLFRWFTFLFLGFFSVILIVFWEPLRSQDFMTSLSQWRPDLLYDIFTAFTFLGDDIGHIFVILIIYWCINKNLGFSTLMILLSSAIYMYLLKSFFSEPRPIEGQLKYDDLSFPSGHTLTTFAVWGYLAMRIRRKVFWMVAVVIAVLMGASRVVLGVHFPGDILGGFIFGTLFLVLVYFICRFYAGRSGEAVSSLSLKLITALVVFSLISILVLVFYNSRDATMVVGFLAGLVIGNILESSLIRFKTDGKWYQHLIKLIVGLAVIFLLAKGIEVDFLDIPHWRLLRFVVSGLWITFLAPFIFTLTHLAEREETQ